MTTENPYEDQTRVNTSKTWLDDQEQVDIDLDGMAEFAEHMDVIRQNLQNEAPYLRDLASLPMQAWEGDVLGEADYVRTRMGDNFVELQVYLQRLSQALTAVGLAAQTIALAYDSTDGWSAATLDAVEFAFGQYGATPPAGFPAGWTTLNDLLREQQEQQGGAPGAGAPQWGNPDSWQTVENADGSVTQVATAPGGHRMEIRTSQVDGATVTTTTVFAPNGTQVRTTTERTSTYSWPYGTTTTTTRTTDGQPDGSTVQSRTHFAGVTTETTTTTNAQGQETSRAETRTETHNDGSQTVTTHDAAGNVTGQVAVGAPTMGGPDLDASPGDDALDEARERY